MISKNSINNIVRKLHLDEFIESHKRLLRDNCGGFLIPFEVKSLTRNMKGIGIFQSTGQFLR